MAFYGNKEIVYFPDGKNGKCFLPLKKKKDTDSVSSAKLLQEVFNEYLMRIHGPWCQHIYERHCQVVGWNYITAIIVVFRKCWMAMAKANTEKKHKNLKEFSFYDLFFLNSFSFEKNITKQKMEKHLSEKKKDRNRRFLFDVSLLL